MGRQAVQGPKQSSEALFSPRAQRLANLCFLVRESAPTGPLLSMALWGSESRFLLRLLLLQQSLSTSSVPAPQGHLPKSVSSLLRGGSQATASILVLGQASQAKVESRSWKKRLGLHCLSIPRSGLPGAGMDWIGHCHEAV